MPSSAAERINRYRQRLKEKQERYN
jgi:hypothetical protein